MKNDAPQLTDESQDDSVIETNLVDEALELEIQQRLWLRAIIPLLQLRSRDSDPSARVQLAYDLMHISACERAGRILRSDLSGDQG